MTELAAGCIGIVVGAGGLWLLSIIMPARPAVGPEKERTKAHEPYDEYDCSLWRAGYDAAKIELAREGTIWVTNTSDHTTPEQIAHVEGKVGERAS